jgi:methionyl-tRNA formyltransferase
MPSLGVSAHSAVEGAFRRFDGVFRQCYRHRMRIVFMGTPDFAVPTLREIFGTGHGIVAVYTRAPTRGGRRGLKYEKTPVHHAAESLGIPVHTPTTFKSEETQEVFRGHAADVAVVLAYGFLLPTPVLEAPKEGCLNLHASLLPRWRGAAPVQRAIMAGETETGVDLMRMKAGIDTGPIALREAIPLRPDDSAGDITRSLAEIAAKLAVRGLRAMERGTLKFREQSGVGACYASKIRNDEAEIDWRLGAAQVRNHIHGLSPAPGAYSNLSIGDRLERLKILRVQVSAADGTPGRILDDEMTVACGEGAVRVVEGQRSGRTVMSGSEIVQRERRIAGATFIPFGTSSSVVSPVVV